MNNSDKESAIHLLLVDDEKGILQEYTEFFRKRNVDVKSTQDSFKALDLLREGNFDVVIVDLRMPKMDGIELIQKIRKEGIDVEVIVLTGHGEKDEAVAALNLDVNGWFDKASIDMPELLKKVKELGEGIPITEVRRILSAFPNK